MIFYVHYCREELHLKVFEDFQDYDIQINGSSDSGFLLNILYKNEKIVPTQRFSTYEDAFHQSRMIVDRDRVKRMNVWT